MDEILPVANVEGGKVFRKEENLPGFCDFSNFIASDPSLEIFRKFEVLGARNLLYLQAELQHLEKQLEVLDMADKEQLFSSNGDSQDKTQIEHAVRSWEALQKQSVEGETRQAEKLQVIQKIRILIQDYGNLPSFSWGSTFLTDIENALLRRNQVLSLEKPAKEAFHALKTWFRRKPPVLWGASFALLHDESDMIALGMQKESDHMSSLIRRSVGYRLRRERATPMSWGPMYYYPTETVNMIVGMLSVVVAAALLVGAIMTLHFVKKITVRLGLVGIFTLIFAASVMLLTNARRVEVYGATAAYAAVLVVFLGVNN